jgi:hypothetical protein
MSKGHRLPLMLLAALLLALVQQQWLSRRPPRLLELRNGGPGSGPASLDLRFSRPLLPASLAAGSRLLPPLAHQWLGQGDPLRLLIRPGQRLGGPLTLELSGRDRRQLALTPQRWHWDPRPRLLAVVPSASGEKLQLLGHDGRWRALTPTLPRLLALQPLGDGSGVALLSGRDLQLLPLRQHNLSRSTLREPQLGPLQRLNREPLNFAHLSSNRRGDLLVQSSSKSDPQGSTVLRSPGGQQRQLPLQASGAIQLLPEGGALVVPETEGLSLRSLPGMPPRRQLLPGSRDLSSFCPVSGRALLVRHWPDFRRSLERVEPGQPPRTLWLGSEAVHASACDRGGERVWLLLSQWRGRQRSTLLALDRGGRVLQRRTLEGWQVEPGTPLQFDPSRRQLLLTLRRQATRDNDGHGQPVLIDADTLRLRPIAQPARLAVWLPAG